MSNKHTSIQIISRNGKQYINVPWPDSAAHNEDPGIIWEKEGNCLVPIES